MGFRNVSAGRRAASIHRAEDAGVDRGGLVCYSLPRNVPFAPHTVPSGPHKGRVVFTTAQERIEFVAKWNDSEWAVRYGEIRWKDSNDF